MVATANFADFTVVRPSGIPFATPKMSRVLKRGSLDHDGRAAGMLTLDATSGCSIFTKLKMNSSIQLGKTGSFMLFATICKWPKLETGKWHGTPCKQ